MRIAQIIYFCLFAFFAQANIWDNLFLGQGVSFRLPEDFIIELAVEQDFGKVTFELTGSSSLNCLSITQGVEIKDNVVINLMTSKLSTYKLNFTAGTLHMNSLLKDCIAVQDDKFETEIYKSIQQFIDIGTLLISREEENGFYKLDAKKLVEMVNVKKIKEFNLKDLPLDKIPTKDLPIDKLDLNKLNASSISENYADKIPQLVFYFDKQNHNLKRIQVTLPNEQKYALEVISIRPYKPNPQDFSLPASWNCDNQQTKPLHELDFKQIVKEVQEKPSPTLALILSLLPEGWAIPDLNKLMDQFKDLLAVKNKSDDDN